MNSNKNPLKFHRFFFKIFFRVKFSIIRKNVKKKKNGKKWSGFSENENGKNGLDFRKMKMENWKSLTLPYTALKCY